VQNEPRLLAKQTGAIDSEGELRIVVTGDVLGCLGITPSILDHLLYQSKPLKSVRLQVLGLVE
jgi:hypothetical protein